MTNKEIIAEIKAGRVQKEWKCHPSEEVRIALAENGYFHDEYIYASSTALKTAVIQSNPEAIRHILYNSDYGKFLRGYFERQVTPNVYHLSEYVKAHDVEPQFQIKLDSLTHKPTLIEETMSPKQLYYAGNPLWAKTLEARQIEIIVKSQQQVDQYGDGQEYIDKMLDTITTDIQANWKISSICDKLIRYRIKTQINERNYMQLEID